MSETNLQKKNWLSSISLDAWAVTLALLLALLVRLGVISKVALVDRAHVIATTTPHKDIQGDRPWLRTL